MVIMIYQLICMSYCGGCYRVIVKTHELNFLSHSNASSIVDMVGEQSRKRGYVFLLDSKPEEGDEYMDDKPLESWLIPPSDFVFDEDAQDKE
jgi:hypothetical protein